MNIEYSDNFLLEAKKLFKKYKLLKKDLQMFVEDVVQNRNLGTSLGHDLYKKRVQNSSIPTGKSGGFRIIIYKKIENNIVLISIYSKTQKESLSDDELKSVLNQYMKDRR